MSPIRLVFRAVIFTLTWFVLTGGALDAWTVGLPTVAVALYVDHRLLSSKGHRLSLIGLMLFVFSFLKFSVIGGIDVIRRAYHPRMPLSPAFIDYPLKLRSPSARLLFMSTVSLLPGTLSAELGENSLTIHVLDDRRPVDRELEMIETRVGAVFGFGTQPEGTASKDHSI